MVSYFFKIWLLLIILQRTYSNLSLQVVQNPNNAYGGEKFLMQPIVQVVNDKSLLQSSFVGSVYVQMGNSPSGFEPLYILRDSNRQGCDEISLVIDCGEKVTGVLASVDIVLGIGTFKDLLIRNVGEDYTLRFILRDANKNSLSNVNSNSFEVMHGIPFKLSFITFPGTSTGGTRFLPFPVLGITDRGSNVVNTIKGHYVTVYLKDNPNNIKLLPLNEIKIPIEYGYALFRNLYIEKSGEYELFFETDMSLAGPKIISYKVLVGVGKAAFLTFATKITEGKVVAGEFFTSPPKLELRDAGGNIVELDSVSAVKVSIAINPSNAALKPSANLFVVAQKGYARFSSIIIDKAGEGFQLLFTVYSYNPLRNKFTETSVKLLSEKFDVDIGPARSIVTMTEGDLAWAGGQPMTIQPVLRLLDFGGNRLIKDYDSIVTSTVMESLSTSVSITVDTKNSPSVKITSVKLNVTNGIYGVGQLISFDVNFESYVSCLGSSVYLSLNIISSDNYYSNASLYGTTSLTNTLSFLYRVQPGDIQQGSSLMFSGIQLNNSKIYDGNEKDANLTLPLFITGSSNVTIDTSPPYVTALYSDLSNGSYGVGQDIKFFIKYSHPVIVTGEPFLILNVWRNNSIVTARYSETSPSGYILSFSYTVLKGDSTSKIAVSDPYINLTSTGQTNSVLRRSDLPTTVANVSIPFLSIFSSIHDISLDVEPPSLNPSFGVRCNRLNGTLYAGDKLLLYLQFDKTVYILGFSITLEMSDRAKGLALFNRLLDDNKTLEFTYTVPKNANTSNLNIIPEGNAIRIYTGVKIARLSTNPTTDVNISTNHITSPMMYYDVNSTTDQQTSITLYGFVPAFKRIYVHSTDPISIGLNATTDNVIYIAVQLNLPVISLCSPVLNLLTPSPNIAEYYIGNGTDTIIFRYIIQLGDKFLSYRFSPNAFCAQKGCALTSDCLILAASEYPSLDGSITMPQEPRYYIINQDGSSELTQGVDFTNIPVVTVDLNRRTYLIKIECLETGTEVGAGASVSFIATFNDAVYPQDLSSTRLFINIVGPENITRYAEYIGGTGTKTLSFTYIVQPGDSASGIFAVNYPNGTALSPVYCPDGKGNFSCTILNYECLNLRSLAQSQGKSCENADLNATDRIIYSPTNVYTLPPVITDVWCEKTTSAYDGYYTIGEEIDIYMEFDRPVLILGVAPSLDLSVGEGRLGLAKYIGLNFTVLQFRYVVAPGDYSEDLTYKSKDSLLLSRSTKIYRFSIIPSTEADSTLPSPTSLARRTGGYIKIKTDNVPKITSVDTLSPNARYAPGDIIYFKMTFSSFVIITGSPFLTLHLGDRNAKTEFLGVNLTAPLDRFKPSLPSKIFYFSYEVSVNDFSPKLDYVDQFSFFKGVTIDGDIGSILQVSSIPTIEASLELPLPGRQGSISYNSSLYIDGSVPYAYSIRFISSPGIYGYGDAIRFAIKFSAPVAVFGTPTIRMETGDVDSYAYYQSGNGTDNLIFLYNPTMGDKSIKLDYFGDREKLLSARDAFSLNGGSIKAYSYRPIADVDVKLNPPGGVLLGALDIQASAGVFYYKDLAIRRRGRDYIVRFSSTPKGANRTITTTQEIFVSFSSENALRPSSVLKGDQTGFSTAIQNDLAIIGAPNHNRSVFEIQTVTTKTARLTPQREVQELGITIESQYEIQSFYTTADPGETIGGYFRIMQSTANLGSVQGPTRLIPANAHPDLLEVYIFDELDLGEVNVTKESYIYCACNNAFKWTVTFLDRKRGDLSPLIFDTSELTGLNAAIEDANTIQDSSFLGGTFTIIALGKETDSIPYDATADQIAEALETIGFQIKDVETLFTPDTFVTRARSWLITFEAYQGFYDVPLLQSNSSGLTGGDIKVWHTVQRPGINAPTGVGGGFHLVFRNHSTNFLTYNASSADVKVALEALPVINTVEVHRSVPSSLNEYTWTITFIEVLTKSARGYLVDGCTIKSCPGGSENHETNLEPLGYINKLIGTNADIVIGAAYNISDSYMYGMPQRMGSFGSKAGAVYVFQHIGEDWIEVATIVGEDTTESDQFGYSLSLDTDLIVVGAIGASSRSKPEIQYLFCNASDGYFKLNFRGWSTSLISSNVTKEELVDAIEADKALLNENKLYTINRILVDDWGGGPLCSGKTAKITFLSPADGHPSLNNGINTKSNLELLGVDAYTLKTIDGLNGMINITSYQNGTGTIVGDNSNIQTHGAAYVFRFVPCVGNSSLCLRDNWVQEAQFIPLSPTGSEGFGTSVSVSNTTVAVGCPGCNNFKGAVYVYNYIHDTKSWVLKQIVSLVGDIYEGGKFGFKVIVRGRDLVVGSPNRPGIRSNGDEVSNQGGVFIFVLSSYDVWIEQQRITGSAAPNSYNLNENDYFGRSFDFDSNTLAVGAFGFDDQMIYLGRSLNEKAPNTGNVFVYRKNNLGIYMFSQRLIASNVKENDYFGWDLALEGDKIVVGAVQEYIGDLVASKPILEMETYADYHGDKLGGTFRLKWRSTSLDNKMSEKVSSPIQNDITADNLKEFLKLELNTGEILVSRTEMDELNGGYLWSITFMELYDNLTPFISDTADLTGTNARVNIRITNPTPPVIRGLTHVFLKDSVSGEFVENSFVSPYTYEPIDRCGWSVSISGSYVLVGCPNRDYIVPNHNGGAATIFNINILQIKYSSPTYEITEGDKLKLSVEIISSKPSDEDILFYIQSLDRNAYGLQQIYLSNIYSIRIDSVAYPGTITDGTFLAGLAMARSQYYGSIHNESVWIDGEYDYRGLSDYVPLKEPKVILSGYSSTYHELITSPDSILESPDETVIVTLNSPGIWPSPLGSLMSVVTILDNSDGFINNALAYDKIYYVNISETDNIGNDVSVDKKAGTMAYGSPSTMAIKDMPNSGSVVLYGSYLSIWVQLAEFISPSPSKEGKFGDSVRLCSIYSQSISILAIGEPGNNTVHIYISEGQDYGISYKYSDQLVKPEDSEKNDLFGSRGSLALKNNIIIIGSRVKEKIYIYHRVYKYNLQKWVWEFKKSVFSSDYDYDIINSVNKVHAQEFGSSIAISGRTFVVGAPYADYEKSGTDLTDLGADTQGFCIRAVGRGKVYVYDILPQIQYINLTSKVQLSEGEFQLALHTKGSNISTIPMKFSITSTKLSEVLVNLNNIDEIKVSSSSENLGSNGFLYSWTVTFVSDFEFVPMLIPKWNSSSSINGLCYDCKEFDKGANVSIKVDCVEFKGGKMEFKLDCTEIDDWKEVQKLQANDRRQGDRFGISLDIDGDQIAVGADFSAAVATSTWDFESGSLTGWGVTGTAFDFQPTFGDNSKYRPTYYGEVGELKKTFPGVGSQLKGRYYIGTYDKRPGFKSDNRVPDPAYPQGNSQGDIPVGTLTSQVFMINGTKISFLIGGGCDMYTEYVELLIDGMSVARHTGKCVETMQRVFFPVEEYKNRAAQIRIVDAASSDFGHINVDDFLFDWDMSGGLVNSDAWGSSIPLYGGLLDTAKAGAVYLYRRHIKDSLDFCTGLSNLCEWSQEVRVMASDKRVGSRFGYSLSVNDAAGVLVVGAPYASLTGIYKENPSVYPFYDAYGISNTVSLSFPLPTRFDFLLQNLPAYTPQPSGARSVWYFAGNQKNDQRLYKESGYVYVYTREPAIQSGDGKVVQAPHWFSTENFKLSAPDLSSHDYFGTSVDIDDNFLVVGAPGQDGFNPEAGAVYFFNAVFTAVSFAQPEFRVLEGTMNIATITVLRDIRVFRGAFDIEYATSDLTAKGVDSDKFDECLTIATNLRADAGCGDYMQTTGIISFNEGSNSGGFNVRIMNNLCKERYFRYVQITLSVPGSSALQGEIVSAKIRIDDDDFLQDACR